MVVIVLNTIDIIEVEIIIAMMVIDIDIMILMMVIKIEIMILMIMDEIINILMHIKMVKIIKEILIYNCLISYNNNKEEELKDK